jgi:sialate O-acetylesterase
MRSLRLLLALASTVAALSVAAEVRLARLFTDHLVLQRDRPVPVWGTAAAGEPVIVEFRSQRVETVADSAGRWLVRLAPLSASAEPAELIVRGTNTVTLRDVLVGEVWFCSGQSNMEKPLGERKGQRPTPAYELEIAASNYPQLRLYQVPRTDLPQSGPGLMRWLPSSPEHLRASNFSAVGYHFGRLLQQTLGVPVGIIHSSFGGTRIEAWLPPEAFADPQLAGLEKVTYQAWVKGVQATELFASMVRPYAPYALRGFLWYQGEANLMAGDIALYAHKQDRLIAEWRRAFETPEASFYGVLLAPFDYSRRPNAVVTAQALPLFWEAQRRGRHGPGTGFVVTTDLVANLRDIHPIEKRRVAERLALQALAGTYGRTDFTAQGPEFAGLRVDGARVEVTFRSARGLHTTDGQPPSHFLVAGADRNFFPASAKVEGDKLHLSAPEVPAPVAVRFAWDEVATPNLVNAQTLPVVPFRTDDWPVAALRPAAVEAPKK